MAILDPILDTLQPNQDYTFTFQMPRFTPAPVTEGRVIGALRPTFNLFERMTFRRDFGTSERASITFRNRGSGYRVGMAGRDMETVLQNRIDKSVAFIEASTGFAPGGKPAPTTSLALWVIGGLALVVFAATFGTGLGKGLALRGATA